MERKEAKRMASETRADRTELSRIQGAKSLRPSSTFAIGYYNVDQCAHQLTTWSKRRERWVYRENVDVALPLNCPVSARTAGSSDVIAGFDKMSESPWEMRTDFDGEDGPGVASPIGEGGGSEDGESEFPHIPRGRRIKSETRRTSRNFRNVCSPYPLSAS